jgi:hypothetical protein
MEAPPRRWSQTSSSLEGPRAGDGATDLDIVSQIGKYIPIWTSLRSPRASTTGIRRPRSRGWSRRSGSRSRWPSTVRRRRRRCATTR